MNVLLVLEDIGLPGQHGRARVVVGRNIDHSQLPTISKDAMGLGDDAAASKTGNLVESVPKEMLLLLGGKSNGMAFECKMNTDYAAGIDRRDALHGECSKLT